MNLQCKPGMITTGNMIALRPRALTLALFNTSQLFQLTMKALHIPPHIVPTANDLYRQTAGDVVRDHPINVAVCGDQLEELHVERHFLEFDHDTRTQTLRSPINLLQMNISFFFAQT